MEFLIVFAIVVFVLAVRAKVKGFFENRYYNERKVYKEKYSPKIVMVKREKMA